MRKIDGKYHIEASIGDDGTTVINIVKTSNGQIIPEDEPLMLFRGRDRLAVPMSENYKQLCVEDGCVEQHIQSAQVCVDLFKKFAQEHPERMKQPGCTLGK